MTEGISKERLLKIAKSPINKNNEKLQFILRWLITTECKELDPWLEVDENTPKDRELAFITKEYGKVIGRWFDTGKKGWWIANCMPVTPTHYKLLSEDPK